MKKSKLVYYEKGRKREIPIHIQKVILIADFEDAVKIEIKSVCHNRKECADWKDLIEFLIPYQKEEDR